MFTSPRSVPLLIVLVVACSSPEPTGAEPEPTGAEPEPEVAGGQSGTDSDGDLQEQCETDGEESDAPIRDTIAVLGTSPSALGDALRGSYSVPWTGGDSAALDAVSIEVEAVQSATVEHGIMAYSDDGQPVNGMEEECAMLSLRADVRIRTEDGALDLTAAELSTVRSTHAAVIVRGPSTLFGVIEDVDVYVGFIGISGTPRAIDVVIDNARGGHALFSREFWSR
jgi:hypothetical protein